MTTEKLTIAAIAGWVVLLAATRPYLRMLRGDEKVIRELKKLIQPSWPFGQWLLRVWLRGTLLAGPWMLLGAIKMTLVVLRQERLIPNDGFVQALSSALSVILLLWRVLTLVISAMGWPRGLLPPGAE